MFYPCESKRRVNRLVTQGKPHFLAHIQGNRQQTTLAPIAFFIPPHTIHTGAYWWTIQSFAIDMREFRLTDFMHNWSIVYFPRRTSARVLANSHLCASVRVLTLTCDVRTYMISRWWDTLYNKFPFEDSVEACRISSENSQAHILFKRLSKRIVWVIVRLGSEFVHIKLKVNDRMASSPPLINFFKF